MQKIEPLLYGNFYHIYNRGINSCPIFTREANYHYFLTLYEKYLFCVVDTYAWVLMKNHFHLLVRIKEEEEIVTFSRDFTKKPIPSHQFAHLLNSYAQAFNRQQNRHGGLFERPFKRKQIRDHSYLKTIVLYIHNNPVHHGCVNHTICYPWSSYHQCISNKLSHSFFKEVLDWFDDLENFKAAHNHPGDPEGVEEWLSL